MPSFIQILLGDVEQIRSALKLEPGIRPSFAKADIGTIIRVMYAAMLNGSFDAPGIYRYLEARGCPFDRETVEFLLNLFDGGDPWHYLWERDELGTYVPLLHADPAWDEVPD